MITRSLLNTYCSASYVTQRFLNSSEVIFKKSITLICSVKGKTSGGAALANFTNLSMKKGKKIQYEKSNIDDLGYDQLLEVMIEVIMLILMWLTGNL